MKKEDFTANFKRTLKELEASTLKVLEGIEKSDKMIQKQMDVALGVKKKKKKK